MPQYRGVVRGFAYVTATVLLVIGIGVGLLSASTANTALVHGRLGQYAPSGIPVKNAPFLPIAGVVRVVHGGVVFATAEVEKSGKFSFQLPAGRYLLKGQPSSSGNWGCEAATIQVKTNTTSVSIDVVCRNFLIDLG